jgi:hypothetical protein
MKIRDESDLQELVRKKLSSFPGPYGWDDILEALNAQVEGTHGEVIDPDSALHTARVQAATQHLGQLSSAELGSTKDKAKVLRSLIGKIRGATQPTSPAHAEEATQHGQGAGNKKERKTTGTGPHPKPRDNNKDAAPATDPDHPEDASTEVEPMPAPRTSISYQELEAKILASVSGTINDALQGATTRAGVAHADAKRAADLRDERVNKLEGLLDTAIQQTRKESTDELN